MIDVEKYAGMTAERMNSMSDKERSEYYKDLYQYAGVMMDLLADVNGVNSLKAVTEHFTYSAAVSAHTALMDALAALVARVE